MKTLTQQEKKRIARDLKDDVISWRFVATRDDEQLKKYLRNKNE